MLIDFSKVLDSIDLELPIAKLHAQWLIEAVFDIGIPILDTLIVYALATDQLTNAVLTVSLSWVLT